MEWCEMYGRCAVQEMCRCEILLSCGGDWCGMYTPCSISHLITSLPPHFTLHHSTSNTISDIIPNHSTFHVGPFLNISYRSDQHLLQRTIPLHNTIFQIAPSRSHASHHSHCTPESQYWCTTQRHIPCTPRHISFGSHHILATSFMHRTGHISYHHILHNIAPHLIVHLIPHPTTMFHITFHITHQHTTTFYIPTHHIMHNTTSTTTYRAVSHSTAHTNPYYITTFHNIPVWETLNYVIRFVTYFTYNLLYHIKPNTKMVVKKCNFIHKVPENIMPVCPNTKLSGSFLIIT